MLACLSTEYSEMSDHMHLPQFLCTALLSTPAARPVLPAPTLEAAAQHLTWTPAPSSHLASLMPSLPTNVPQTAVFPSTKSLVLPLTILLDIVTGFPGQERSSLNSSLSHTRVTLFPSSTSCHPSGHSDLFAIANPTKSFKHSISIRYPFPFSKGQAPFYFYFFKQALTYPSRPRPMAGISSATHP